MKTLILASAAVLALGVGSSFAATTDAAQQNQQQVAINAQARGSRTGSAFRKSFNAPANTHYVGGWQPLPPNSGWGGD